MGFSDVYDYAGGKADWIAMGLPTEGTQIPEPRIEQVARRNAPRCTIKDTVAEIRTKVEADGLCVVLNSDNIVLGLVALSGNEGMSATAEEIMDPAPPTFRPGVPVSELREHFESRGIPNALVTTSIGEFIGVLTRAEIGI
jgi:CBS domain-containing protein